MSKRLLVKKQDVVIPELSQEIPANGIITVGSDLSSTIQLNEENISTEQFVIVCEENKMTLLSRADGNFVNGLSLPQGSLHLLEIEDEITINDYKIIVETDEPKPPKLGKKAKESKQKAKKMAETFDNFEENDKYQHSLSDILAGLRTEEKFYFQIANTQGETTRYYIEKEEMFLGWTVEGECLISNEKEELSIIQAEILKDWTGVVLTPAKPKSAWINNEPLIEPRRLKNDDKILIAEKSGKKSSPLFQINFHEPTALLVLDSILPKELPMPISLDEQKNGLIEGQSKLADSKNIHSSQIPPIVKKRKKKKVFFGYFTLSEIIIMTFGTLITALIVFLILELY